MRVAIYACVSTKDKGQGTENQLREVAEWHGSVYKIFTYQESGGRADRTELKLLLLKVY